MVSSASDYVFVTDLDNIKINGEIMPLRNGDHKRDLRGEDIAFALEAYAECYDMMLAGHYTASMKDTRLLAVRPRTACMGLKSIVDELDKSYYADKEIIATHEMTFSGGRVASGEWRLFEHFGSYFSSLKITPQMNADEDAFQAGKECRQEDIEDLLEDTQKLRAIVIRAAGLVHDVTYEKKATGSLEPGDYDYSYNYFNFPPGHPREHYNGEYESIANGGYSFLRRAHVGPECTALAYCFFNCLSDGGTDTYMVPISATVESDAIRIPGAAVGNAARMVAQWKGIPSGGTSGGIYVNLNEVAFHIFRGNHTLY